jgi:hypothetical protein
VSLNHAACIVERCGTLERRVAQGIRESDPNRRTFGGRFAHLVKHREIARANDVRSVRFP